MGAALLTILLFALSSFGPGFYVVRRCGWEIEETIAASFGISMIFLYLGSLCVFVANGPPGLHYLLTLTCLILTVLSGPDLLRFLRDERSRRIFTWFGIVALWLLVLLALIRNYSGGAWYGDWLEHFQRSLHFAERGPADAKFLDRYTLPSRPPLMNLICAHFMAQAGRTFAVYQVSSTLLNMLVFISACQALSLFSKARRAPVSILAAFLMFNPLFVQNTTYAWTKLLTAFFVVSGTCLYAAGLSRPSRSRTLIAFALLCGGVLAHYSAVPYLLFLGTHYAVSLLRRGKIPWKEPVSVGLLCAAVLASWFTFSVATYGAAITFGSSSAVKDTSRRSFAANAGKVLLNVRDTIVPHVLRDVDLTWFRQSNRWGSLRDTLIEIYDRNLFFIFGSVGAALLARLFLRRPPAPSSEGPAAPRFWFAYAAFNIVAGIAVHGTPMALGLAHICLQPLAILGLTFLAARVSSLGRPWRLAALAGLAVDLCFGVFLHIWIEGIAVVKVPLGGGNWTLDARDGLSLLTYGNWRLKVENDLMFLGDQVSAFKAPLQVIVLATAAAVLYLFFRRVLEAQGRTPRTFD